MDSKQRKAFAHSVGLMRAERALARALRNLAAAEHVMKTDASAWWSEGSRSRVREAGVSVKFWAEIIAELSAARVAA
jgi:hypothetical protein